MLTPWFHPSVKKKTFPKIPQVVLQFLFDASVECSISFYWGATVDACNKLLKACGFWVFCGEGLVFCVFSKKTVEENNVFFWKELDLYMFWLFVLDCKVGGFISHRTTSMFFSPTVVEVNGNQWSFVNISLVVEKIGAPWLAKMMICIFPYCCHCLHGIHTDKSRIQSADSTGNTFVGWWKYRISEIIVLMFGTTFFRTPTWCRITFRISIFAPKFSLFISQTFFRPKMLRNKITTSHQSVFLLCDAS